MRLFGGGQSWSIDMGKSPSDGARGSPVSTPERGHP